MMKQMTLNDTCTLSDEFLTVLYENTYLSDREKEYLLSIMEMTKEETYRWNRFKDRYHVTPKDKNGDRELTLNGQRVKVHEPKDDKVISSNQAGDLNINIEKLCMIPNDSEIDAVMQHEDGHRKLHTLNPNSDILDKKRTDLQLRADVAREILQKISNDNYLQDSDLATKVDKYIDMKMSDANKNQKDDELVRKRKAFRLEMLKKYVKKGSYVDANELEADQYAANKVGRNAMIQALKSMDSLDSDYLKMDIDKKIKDTMKTPYFISLNDDERDNHIKKITETMKQEYAQLHQNHVNDTKIRKNALKDSSIGESLRKALSD